MSSPSLPGVRVGPLDPDRTADFGQISQRHSARQLVRLHAQAYPTALRRALALKQDVERSRALDMDEVRDYLDGVVLDNGDPAVPDGSEVVGAAVRGERDRPQTLTYTFRVTESGRTGKWYASYGEEQLPKSFAEGTERVRVSELRQRGIVTTEDGTGEHAKLKTANAALAEEVARLRAAQAADEEAAPGQSEVEKDERDLECERLRARVEELEKDAEAAAAGAPDDKAAAGDGAPVSTEPTSAQDEPIEGYDDLKAADVVKLLKAPATTDGERQAIVDYEKTHANRRSVVGAAEVALGDRGSAE